MSSRPGGAPGAPAVPTAGTGGKSKAFLLLVGALALAAVAVLVSWLLSRGGTSAPAAGGGGIIGGGGGTASATTTAAPAAAEGCVLGGVNWCAAEPGPTNAMLVHQKSTAALGVDTGIHNDCWQNNALANAGVINAARVLLSYDSTKKTYKIWSSGCGASGYRLCAFDVPANVFGSASYVQWLRNDQKAAPLAGADSTNPQSGAVSCDWNIAPTTGGLKIRVPFDAPVSSQLRGALLGTDLAKMGFWNDQSGKPYYALLTTRMADSDETVWSIKP